MGIFGEKGLFAPPGVLSHTHVHSHIHSLILSLPHLLTLQGVDLWDQMNGVVWATATASNILNFFLSNGYSLSTMDYRSRISLAYQLTDLPVAIFYIYPPLQKNERVAAWVYLSAVLNGILGLARAWLDNVDASGNENVKEAPEITKVNEEKKYD